MEFRLRLPWNSAFDLWHEYWFDAAVHPKVRLDHATVIKDVLREDLYAIVPNNVGMELIRSRPEFALCEIEEGPADETIHCLSSVASQQKFPVQHFMELLKNRLQTMEGIHCYL